MAAISATPHAAEMASVSAPAPLSPRVPKAGQHRARQQASAGPHAPPLGSGALTNGDVGVTSHIHHAMCYSHVFTFCLALTVFSELNKEGNCLIYLTP